MQSGSTSRETESLEITQPAVSRLVAELEKTIGFSLFDRARGRPDRHPNAASSTLTLSAISLGRRS